MPLLGISSSGGVEWGNGMRAKPLLHLDTCFRLQMSSPHQWYKNTKHCFISTKFCNKQPPGFWLSSFIRYTYGENPSRLPGIFLLRQWTAYTLSLAQMRSFLLTNQLNSWWDTSSSVSSCPAYAGFAFVDQWGSLRDGQMLLLLHGGITSLGISQWDFT